MIGVPTVCIYLADTCDVVDYFSGVTEHPLPPSLIMHCLHWYSLSATMSKPDNAAVNKVFNHLYILEAVYHSAIYNENLEEVWGQNLKELVCTDHLILFLYLLLLTECNLDSSVQGSPDSCNHTTPALSVEVCEGL